MRWVWRLLVVLIGILLVTMFLVSTYLDSGIRAAINKHGPALAKTDVHLDSVSTSLLGGTVSFEGLTVGNPAGFDSATALTLRKIKAEANLVKLFGEALEINELEIDGLDLYVEQRLGSQNNLQKLANQLRESSSQKETAPSEPPKSGEAPATKAPRKDVIIKRLIITSCRVHTDVKGVKELSGTVTIPNMILRDIGTQEGGIPVGQVAAIILDKIVEAYQRAQVEKQGEKLLKDQLEDAGDKVKQELERLIKRF